MLRNVVGGLFAVDDVPTVDMTKRYRTEMDHQLPQLGQTSDVLINEVSMLSGRGAGELELPRETK